MFCAGADRPAHRRGQSGPRTVRLQGRTVRSAPFGAQQDGNSDRGHGYPRVSYPMDMDTGKKSRPRVKIRSTLLTRG
jgi:hypothetical protein